MCQFSKVPCVKQPFFRCQVCVYSLHRKQDFAVLIFGCFVCLFLKWGLLYFFLFLIKKDFSFNAIEICVINSYFSDLWFLHIEDKRILYSKPLLSTLTFYFYFSSLYILMFSDKLYYYWDLKTKNNEVQYNLNRKFYKNKDSPCGLWEYEE